MRCLERSALKQPALPPDFDNPPSNFDARSRVVLTVPQMWAMVVSIIVAAFIAAVQWSHVNERLEVIDRHMRSEAWTLRDASDFENGMRIKNPALHFPNSREIHRDNHP